MEKHKLILVLFCILLPLFLIFLSYKTTLFFTGLSPNQEKTFSFLEGKQLELNYTNSEVSHLNDVKKVINNLNYFFYFSLILIILILFYYHNYRSQLQKLLFYGGWTTVLFLIVLLFLVLINFNGTFTVFHRLFFPQGNWLFPSDSLLIQTFPMGFFVKASEKIFLLALTLGIVVTIMGYKIKKKRSINKM